MKKLTLLFTFLLNSMLYAQDIIDIGLYNQHLDLIDRGWELIHEGKNSEAIEYFEKAIEINGNNADSYVGAATAFMNLGQYELAIHRVDSALSLTNNQSDIYYLAGNIAFNSKDYNKALILYTVAINNNTSSEVKIDLAKCHFNRGNAYMSLKRYQSAIMDYDKTLQSATDFADAYHNRGIAFKNLSDNENACRDFHAAKHFGSQISDKYLLDYCKEEKFTPLDYQNLKYVSNENSTGKSDHSTIETDYSVIVDYSDTSFIDTLYYDDDWALSNKELGSYYRVGTVNTKALIFTGDFTDYYRSGQLMLKGTYDQDGKKTGTFERFYESGEYCSKGRYSKDQLIGTWEFFNENGQLSETIEFDQDDYYVINSWDEKGKPGVVDGTGKWKKVVSVHYGVTNFLIGHFKNKKKVKKWMLKSENGVFFHIEKYKNGKFISAKGKKEFTGFVSAPQLFSKNIFYPESLPILERFEISEHITTRDYPYIKGLSKYLPLGESYSYKSYSYETNSDSPIPTYEGGMKAFYQFVGQNLRYPMEARNNRTTGKVIVEFTIEKDGSVSNIHCLSNLGDGLEDEAIRLISKTNQWMPAIVDGSPVVKSLVLPITFMLN